MLEQNTDSVAFISSYVPRKCGVATFTHDLATAVSRECLGQPLSGNSHAGIVALNDRDDFYTYGDEVVAQVGEHRREDYRIAAEVLNASHAKVVSLQHEYGLYGGENGDYVFDLLDRLDRPIVPTLHTILSKPSPGQLAVLRRICRKSSAVVVMADRARELLIDVYGAPAERIHKIHHGVPEMPFGDTEPFKRRYGLAGRPIVLTFGLLGPGKGIETMLDAIADVIPQFPNLAYIILGVTHPAEKRESGESYRLSLESRAVELGIQRNVLFHNRYVSSRDLCEYLQAADIYVTPYRAKEQITSGTLAYALAAGKAIISTPYWYAEELLANHRGVLVDFGSVGGFAAALRDLLEKPDEREQIRRSAYDYARQMVWPEVARRYWETFKKATEAFARRPTEFAPRRKTLLRMSLPDVHFDHLVNMTDDTGLLQHAVFSLPNRAHGYSTDDNARAVVVCSMQWALFQDEEIVRYLNTYLSYLHFAQPSGGGRFRNFMSYDRRWFDQDGSDDCQGRVIWALGHLVSHAPNDSVQELARQLFHVAVPAIRTLEHPRSWSLSILGLHYYLREQESDAEAIAYETDLARRLCGITTAHESHDWHWFEDRVSYDNARLPQALIIAGFDLNDREMVDCGLRVLDWLLDIQTGEGGRLSVIGNHGWHRRGAEKPRFDQQPLEAAALIGACKAAYRVSGDSRWLDEMRRCFEWYLGRNDMGVALIDFKTMGCYDAITANGVNRNQGAESVLSWLLSLLTMHEMQTGYPPDVG